MTHHSLPGPPSGPQCSRRVHPQRKRWRIQTSPLEKKKTVILLPFINPSFQRVVVVQQYITAGVEALMFVCHVAVEGSRVVWCS